MTTLRGLVLATHPLPAAAVTAIVGLLVAWRGADAATVALAVLSTAAGQASVGWSNDSLDRDRDAAAGRREKPIVAGLVGASAVWRGAVIAAVVSLALSAPLGWVPTAIMGVGVGSAWLYNAGLKDTALSWVPYAVSFGLAPWYVWEVSAEAASPLWIVGGASAVGVAAHLLNVVPDLEADRPSGARGLPHRLGARGSMLLASALLLAVLALVLVEAGDGGPIQIVAATVGVAAIAGMAISVLWGQPRLGFRLTIAAASAIVATLVLGRWPA